MVSGRSRRSAVRNGLTATVVERRLARRDNFVDHQDDAPQVREIQDMPATFFRGQGRLAGERRVDVTGPQGRTTPLTARHAVVLATGSDPFIPDLPSLRAAHPWTKREATILADDRLLPRLEPFTGELLAQSFRESGIDVRLGRTATDVRRPIADGPAGCKASATSTAGICLLTRASTRPGSVPT
jgi:hypothetical protein